MTDHHSHTFVTQRERIGIRELKGHLSEVLKKVRSGCHVVVTDRNEPIAILVPWEDRRVGTRIELLIHSGVVAWTGGKPTGCSLPPVVKGPSVADAVVEDRR